MLVPLLMTMLLPFVYLYLHNSSDKPMKKEYEEEEVLAASGALALMVLRIRDGKTRDTIANGVLRKLTKELILSAQSEGGYPDSDDDDVDSGDDEQEQEQEKESGKGAGGGEGVHAEDVHRYHRGTSTSVFMK